MATALDSSQLLQELEQNTLKVVDLRNELRNRGLPSTGLKSELRERLLNFIQNDSDDNKENQASKLNAAPLTPPTKSPRRMTRSSARKSSIDPSSLPSLSNKPSASPRKKVARKLIDFSDANTESTANDNIETEKPTGDGEFKEDISTIIVSEVVSQVVIMSESPVEQAHSETFLELSHEHSIVQQEVTEQPITTIETSTTTTTSEIVAEIPTTPSAVFPVIKSLCFLTVGVALLVLTTVNPLYPHIEQALVNSPLDLSRLPSLTNGNVLVQILGLNFIITSVILLLSSIGGRRTPSENKSVIVQESIVSSETVVASVEQSVDVQSVLNNLEARRTDITEQMDKMEEELRSIDRELEAAEQEDASADRVSRLQEKKMNLQRLINTQKPLLMELEHNVIGMEDRLIEQQVQAVLQQHAQ